MGNIVLHCFTMSLIDSFPNLEYDHAIFGIVGKASTGLLPQNRDLTVNISDMSALDYERWIMVHISLVSCLLFLPCKENFSLKRSRIFPSWSQGILVDDTIRDFGRMNTDLSQKWRFVRSALLKMLFSTPCVRNQVATIHRHWEM